ncbi:MAG: hydrogenase maturation nickel metallochaperone HypA [Acidobacteriota bacterium]|nr:hydrogenase maturation nickel metallochaperone HypA [Acidobacteriota bacterium]
MHELSVALSIIEGVTEEAAKHENAQVEAVHLKLGRLSGVVKDALLFSWEIACQGTILENVRLEIEEIPVVAFCGNCQANQIIAAINNLVCPQCETPATEIVGGRELMVTALEIYEKD